MDLISNTMATLILFSQLPLAVSANQPASIYQEIISVYSDKTKLKVLNLDEIAQDICTAWGARFGNLDDRQKPKWGTTYTNPKNRPKAGSSRALQQSAECNTAI